MSVKLPQDWCADGRHIYTRSARDGEMRCRCGAVLDVKARSVVEVSARFDVQDTQKDPA